MRFVYTINIWNGKLSVTCPFDNTSCQSKGTSDNTYQVEGTLLELERVHDVSAFCVVVTKSDMGDIISYRTIIMLQPKENINRDCT